jgi:hypothetical protein
LRAWHINRELQNGVDVFAAIDKSGVSQPYRLVANWRLLRPDERSQRNPKYRQHIQSVNGSLR